MHHVYGFPDCCSGRADALAGLHLHARQFAALIHLVAAVPDGIRLTGLLESNNAPRDGGQFIVYTCAHTDIERGPQRRRLFDRRHLDATIQYVSNYLRPELAFCRAAREEDPVKGAPGQFLDDLHFDRSNQPELDPAEGAGGELAAQPVEYPAAKHWHVRDASKNLKNHLQPVFSRWLPLPGLILHQHAPLRRVRG